MNLARALWMTLALALVGVAAANVCQAELSRAVPPGAPPGEVAAAIVARAMQLIEPAYPGEARGNPPVDGATQALDAIAYLHERGRLPQGWTVANHDSNAWGQMLQRLAGPYRVAIPQVTGADTATMLQEAGTVLAAVSNAVRPLAVLAVQGDQSVSLMLVIWNWTPYPRLLAFRPTAAMRLGAGGRDEAVRPALAAIETCAFRLPYFVQAPEEVALRLFLQQGASTMRVFASEPQQLDVPRAIASESVVDVLTFRSPLVAGANVLAVAVDGPAPGFGSVISVLLQARTNAGLNEVLRALELP